MTDTNILRTPGRVVLSVKDLSVQYKAKRGDLQAVRNVSFDLHAGEVLALIGESGSGKTTLGLGLIRLLPITSKLQADEIVFNRYTDTGELNKQVDLIKLNDSGLRQFRWQECAMVFQSALNSLNPVLRVSEHFIETAKDHGKPVDKGFERFCFDLLDKVHLDPERVWKSYPYELSGGMRQRVILALALLLEPEILILDEPSTALDILTQRTIINLLKELRDDLGFAMIFISHDLSLAAELADQVATMYAGMIIEQADVFTTFSQPYHPYTIGLIKAVPTLRTKDEELSSIPGSPPDLISMPTGCKFHPRCDYATEKCVAEEPPLVDVNFQHRVACWHWKEIREKQISLGRSA